MKIVPAILTDNLETFKKQLLQAETFSDEVDIDVLNNTLVKEKTLPLLDMLEVETTLVRHLHLMTENPSEDIKLALDYGIKSVVVHAKADLEWINFDELPLKVGVSLSPETAVDVIGIHLNTLSLVQLMTVVPGEQGGQFRKDVLKKADELRTLGFKGEIKADGGVKDTNISDLEAAGIDSVSVGSYIWKSKDPKEAYKKLQEIVQSNEVYSKG
ncbi:MAG TPA: hypothetical protein ENI23_07115 [bacterium]|nr:hypothetical protein [bacterium]